MPSEKFPKAFNRFLEKYDITDKRFGEVIDLFQEWQSEHKASVSSEQRQAIGECVEKFISTSWERQYITYNFRGWAKTRAVFRDKKTGRFVSIR